MLRNAVTMLTFRSKEVIQDLLFLKMPKNSGSVGRRYENGEKMDFE